VIPPLSRAPTPGPRPLTPSPVAANYSLKQTVAPTEEPLIASEAKKQLEVADAIVAHDAHLNRLIVSARTKAELHLNRQLVTATWQLVLDRFPRGRQPLLLPKAPLQSVASITYLDLAGNSQTMSPALYKVLPNREPGEVALKYAQIWPITIPEAEAVTITYVSGYGDRTAVPQLLKDAMLVMIASWFNNRDGAAEVPQAAIDLLNYFAYGDEFTEFAGGCSFSQER
jgi:uncharacterized phiE125 gp8 family phage protein